MNSPASVRHVIYISTTSAGNPPDAFAQICALSRQRNAASGIGGVLLYDGQHFAQLLCGPEAAVGALMQRIAQDPRHESVRILFDGLRQPEQPPPHWRAGYTTPEALPAFVQRTATAGADVAAEFAALLPHADLWPPVPGRP